MWLPNFEAYKNYDQLKQRIEQNYIPRIKWGIANYKGDEELRDAWIDTLNEEQFWLKCDLERLQSMGNVFTNDKVSY